MENSTEGQEISLTITVSEGQTLTFDWRPGQIIADQHSVTIKPDTPPGDYRILVGMYLPETGARLNVLDGMGQPVANFIELTSVPIK